MHQLGFGQRDSHAVGDVLRSQAALCQGQSLGIVRRNIAHGTQIVECGAQLLDFLAQLPDFAFKVGTRQMLGQLLAETGHGGGRFHSGCRAGKQFQIDHVMPFGTPGDGRRRHRLSQFGG